MRNPFDALPPHDSRDPALLRIAHAALCADESLWRRCSFVGLRLIEGELHELRQCPQCPSVVLHPTGFAEAAKALAGRLANLGVPLSLSQAAQALADWASQTASQPIASGLAAGPTAAAPTDGPQVLRIVIGTSLKEAERRLILAALETCEGSRSETAHALGLSRRTLYNKLASIRRRQSSSEAPPSPIGPTSNPSGGRPRYIPDMKPRKRTAPLPKSERIASHSK